MWHHIDGTPQLQIDRESTPSVSRVVASDVLEPGQQLRIVKLVSHGWSKRRTQPALRDQVAAGAGGGAADRHRRPARRAAPLPRRLLGRADVELEGDPELQQAVRFALFHVLQAGARTERRAIPPRA